MPTDKLSYLNHQVPFRPSADEHEILQVGFAAIEGRFLSEVLVVISEFDVVND